MKTEDIQKIELKDRGEVKIIVEETTSTWKSITITVIAGKTIVRTTKHEL